MKRRPTHWIYPFALAMAAYAAPLAEAGASAAGSGLWLASRAGGLVALLWAARNLLMRDLRRFSAKRSAARLARRAKMRGTDHSEGR